MLYHEEHPGEGEYELVRLFPHEPDSFNEGYGKTVFYLDIYDDTDTVYTEWYRGENSLGLTKVWYNNTIKIEPKLKTGYPYITIVK